MSDPEHLEILHHGVETWNEWRQANPDTTPDLAGANLYEANLRRANLSGANLSTADLRRANLREASLDRADLTGAQLYRANLNRADLRDATLVGANLYRVYLGRADMGNADLRSADLGMTVLVKTNIDGVRLTDARVHGISAWDLEGVPADQTDLVITPDVVAQDVTVDNLKMAQFVYLLLTNEEISDVIDTITSKVVLILGRFTEERKAVLDRIRVELRARDLSPILFDFDPSENQDITDTVTLLARMARYVIADITDPRSVQQELSLIAPQVVVAIKPIILAGQEPWAMFDDLRRRSPGLMKPHTYTDLEDLLANLDSQVLQPLATKREQLKTLLDAD